MAGHPYADIIARVAAKYGLPLDLFDAQIRQESQYDPNARSGAGAVGLGQVMPDTARQPGYGVRPISEADLTDPEKNLDFSGEYMAAMVKANGGDYRKALASYNAGHGTIQKRGMNNLPRETRDYVQKIYGGDPITVRDIMSGATHTAPGRPVNTRLKFNPMEEASSGRNNYTAARRDAVSADPKEEMGWLEGFLTTEGGLLNRIGGAIAASNGRHPVQLYEEKEARTAAEKNTPSDRYAYAVKVPGVTPDMAMQYAQTGDLSVFEGLSPDAFKDADKIGSDGLSGNQSQGIVIDGEGNPRVVSFDRGANRATALPIEGLAGNKMTRPQDTGIGTANELSEKELAAYRTDVRDSYRGLSSIDRMSDIVRKAPDMFGANVGTRVARILAKTAGVSVGNWDATDQALFEQLQADKTITEAGRLAGQGPITDFERGVISTTLPQLDNTPEANEQILSTMRQTAVRKAQIYQDYTDADPNTRGSINDFEIRWMKKQNDTQWMDFASKATPEEFMARVNTLPTGAEFIGQDGNRYRK
jgi:hypothetical protein